MKPKHCDLCGKEQAAPVQFEPEPQRACPVTSFSPVLCYQKACETEPCREARIQNIRFEAEFNDCQNAPKVYIYRVKNNSLRAKLYGRRCAVTARGKKNSVSIVFLDTGEEVITSRNFLRLENK
jgi:hypothetical protein